MSIYALIETNRLVLYEIWIDDNHNAITLYVNNQYMSTKSRYTTYIMSDYISIIDDKLEQKEHHDRGYVYNIIYQTNDKEEFDYYMYAYKLVYHL